MFDHMPDYRISCLSVIPAVFLRAARGNGGVEPCADLHVALLSHSTAQPHGMISSQTEVDRTTRVYCISLF